MFAFVEGMIASKEAHSVLLWSRRNSSCFDKGHMSMVHILYLVALSILPSTNVTCSLTTFGGSMCPWWYTFMNVLDVFLSNFCCESADHTTDCVFGDKAKMILSIA